MDLSELEKRFKKKMAEKPSRDEKIPVSMPEGRRPVADNDEGDYSGKEEKMSGGARGAGEQVGPDAFRSEFHKMKDPRDDHPAKVAYEEHQEKAKLAQELYTKSGEHVDEGLWDKGKKASQEAFGKIKWPFVRWWYDKQGGK